MSPGVAGGLLNLKKYAGDAFVERLCLSSSYLLIPNVDIELLDAVSQISHQTRVEASNENPRLTSGVSTRTSVEIAGLLFDGFSLPEASEITIYPQYSNDGGIDSERTFVKQLVQRFVKDSRTNDESMFN